MADDYTPPATQEEFDRIIAGRLAREREKYADYDDLKTKVGSLSAERDGLASDREAWTTERDGWATKESELTNRAQTAESELLRSRVAFKHGIDPDLIFGDTEDVLTERAQKIAALKTTAKPPLAPTGNERPPAPASGKGRAAAALRDMRRG